MREIADSTVADYRRKRNAVSIDANSAYQVIAFEDLPPIECPCGIARRGLLDVPSVPYSLHVTEISAIARSHYHKATTETYFVLDCDADAALELDGERISIRQQSAIVIHPGTRHRAIGTMRIMLIASPKFDPLDEWFDD